MQSFFCMEIYSRRWPLDELISSQPSRCERRRSACIILNAPMVSHSVLASMLSSSVLNICADGGSNIMYDTMGDQQDPILPDAVIGDLDSIRQEVKQFYEERGVSILQIVDQDRTDLEKAMDFAESNLRGAEPCFISIIGSIGAHEGRIDQFFAVMNVMFRFKNSPVLRPVQVGNQSILLVLDEGRHEVQLPLSAVGRHCGLVPAFGKVERLVSTGFEWNLAADMGPSCFGGLVSTNNIIRSQLVTIETSDPILLTITYR